MTALRRPVRRTVERERRNLVVTLWPGDPAEIEVRESRRRTGYRVTIAALHTMLAVRAAGIEARGRRARRVAL